MHPDVKKVFLVGMSGLRENLESVGIEVVGPDKEFENYIDMEEFN